MRPETTSNPALLMLLPGAAGPASGGVSTWAVRVLNALSRLGLPVGLSIEGDPAAWPVDRSIELFRLDETDAQPEVRFAGGGATNQGSLTDDTADLTAFLPVCLHAIDRLAARTDGPVVLAPQLLGAAYGLAAELTRRRPDRTRLVGWAHSDNSYDAAVLERYAPALSTAAGVSMHLAGLLADRLPDDVIVEHVPYGVAIPPAPPRTSVKGRPLRLLYAGRLDDRQKRASSLPAISGALIERGVDHTLTVVGGGPLAQTLRDLATPAMRLTGPRDPAVVAEMLRQADGFVLPSRYEGLSLAMLEAMSAGCVPIVARVRSGAEDAITHGREGLLIDLPEDAGSNEIGLRFADAIAGLTPERWSSMAGAAHARASGRFTFESHVARVAGVLGRVATQPARPWPGDRPAAFAALGGLIPADARSRVTEALKRLAGRRLAIHGTGAHTRAAGDLFRTAGDGLVAFTDDDPSRLGGELLGRPVVPPDELAELGVTDVLISSAVHEPEIWARRGSYQRLGIAVHRLYDDAAQPAAAA